MQEIQPCVLQPALDWNVHELRRIPRADVEDSTGVVSAVFAGMVSELVYHLDEVFIARASRHHVLIKAGCLQKRRIEQSAPDCSDH